MTLLKRLDRWLFAPIPRERLRLLRMAIGLYAFVYLAARASHLTAPVRYPASSFQPVGLASWLSTPLPTAAVHAGVALSLGLSVLFTAGVRYRVVAPCFAVSLLWVLTYRHSFGMIFHTDNLLALHVLCLALAPEAAARANAATSRTEDRSEDVAVAWPARVLCVVTVASYVVAGVAKLRITGLDWAGGDVLREHIAYDAIRKIELGSIYSPLAPLLLPYPAVFPPLAAFALAAEVLAPLALFGPRLALVWCVSAWLFHLGVLALMAIAFPYPLSGCAYLAFFPLERWARRAPAVVRRIILGAGTATVDGHARRFAIGSGPRTR